MKLPQDFKKNRKYHPIKKGNYVIVWSSFQRRVNRKISLTLKQEYLMNKVRSLKKYLINTFQPHSQTRPSVVMDSAGDFIVVWESWHQDGSERGIYAQKFNNAGTKEGSEFLVNSTTEFSQCKPTISFFSDGKYIIAWESWLETEKGYNLFAKIYDRPTISY